MSGAGKTYISNILIDKFGFIFLTKYTTRPFRNEEIEKCRSGECIDLKAVIGKYNNGELNAYEQKENQDTRKQAFLKLKLPFSYFMYENYYGFSLQELNNYLIEGKNVVLICNDSQVMRDLKSIYRNNCQIWFVYRNNPSNKNIFLEIAKRRGDTEESAEDRYKRAIKDFNRYIGNINLFDYILLNIENESNRIIKIIERILKNHKKYREESLLKNNKDFKAKLYIYAGNPGSGKDDILNIIKSQSRLHSIVMPKYTTRERRKDDGEELICINDKFYDMDLCDLQYESYGTTYGINIKELEERMKKNISSSLVASDIDIIKKLEQLFPNQVVKIYVYGLTEEEFKIQHKEYFEEEYLQKRLLEYKKTDRIFLDTYPLVFNHIILNNGDYTDLAIQVNNIIHFYEYKRKLNIKSALEYTELLKKYDNK